MDEGRYFISRREKVTFLIAKTYRAQIMAQCIRRETMDNGCKSSETLYFKDGPNKFPALENPRHYPSSWQRVGK
jgi:hypothetical protein